MPALLLGSISTVADTSERQRQAFNQAFEAHGLDWRWDQDQYRSMLSRSGGQARNTSGLLDRQSTPTRITQARAAARPPAQ